jgi:transcriptional regulator of acetoin/glycerol metabolism
MTQSKGLTVEKVRAALELSNGSVTAAAKLLGCSRQTVYDWMHSREIRVERRVVPAKDAA